MCLISPWKHVVGTRCKRLTEALPKSTHNIYFLWRNKTQICGYPLLSEALAWRYSMKYFRIHKNNNMHLSHPYFVNRSCCLATSTKKKKKKRKRFWKLHDNETISAISKMTKIKTSCDKWTLIFDFHFISLSAVWNNFDLRQKSVKRFFATRVWIDNSTSVHL